MCVNWQRINTAAKSGNNVICDVFWACFNYSFPKDNLCCCVFKGRSGVAAEMFADFFLV